MTEIFIAERSGKSYVAKRKARKRSLVVIPFQGTLALGTLGAGALIDANLLSAAFGEDYFCFSMDLLAHLETNTAGDGPLKVGIAHDDLTVGEVQEAITAEMTDPDDIIAKERSRRPVRQMFTFNGLAATEVVNDGMSLRQKVMWSIGDTHNINLWAQNDDADARQNGGIIQFSGKLFGRWQR